MNKDSEKIDILDDGFVRLVDWMGDDSSVVQAARVSYGAGTKSVSDDRSLIRYLMRHRHTTPFEMVEFKFHVRVPMDCWRQWIRHRMVNCNEYSTRYSKAIDSQQTTAEDQWRRQASNNKQGSSGNLPAAVDAHGAIDGKYLSERENQLHRLSRRVYEERLEAGVAREQARKDLPLSTYTEAYWKIDLHNLMHFLSLRMASNAQYEIRQYANAIFELISPIVPTTAKAFCDYRLESVTLTGIEINVLKTMLENGSFEAGVSLSGPEDWQKDRCREREECREKFTALGLM